MLSGRSRGPAPLRRVSPLGEERCPTSRSLRTFRPRRYRTSLDGPWRVFLFLLEVVVEPCLQGDHVPQRASYTALCSFIPVGPAKDFVDSKATGVVVVGQGVVAFPFEPDPRLHKRHPESGREMASDTFLGPGGGAVIALCSGSAKGHPVAAMTGRTRAGRLEFEDRLSIGKQVWNGCHSKSKTSGLTLRVDLENYMYVAGNIQTTRRRVDVSFSVHKEVAGLPTAI